MLNLTEDISKLNLSHEIMTILTKNKINTISELWSLKRKDLKNMGLKDSKINTIIIKLQLIGLDLNKKKYNN